MHIETGTPVNALKQRLMSGQPALSLAVRLIRSIEIAGLAKAAGFDTIYVDMEHSSISLEATNQICMASTAVGVTPMVRVASISQIPAVLDGGAQGVIVPHVESAEAAREAVRAARFAPLGERSIPGALMPQFGYRPVPSARMAQGLNDSTLVVVMIESAAALAEVDAIASVDGVDMLFVGTNDLCASLGIVGQLDHPYVRQAYDTCLEACNTHKKHLGVGGLSSKPELAAEIVRRGARFISVGTDIAFLLSGATLKVNTQCEEIARLQSRRSTLLSTEKDMPKAYWINTYREVSDDAALAEYGKLAAPAIVAGGGRFLARGLPGEVYEAGQRQRTILIEFDSLAQAVATHDGPGYQAALKALGEGAVRDIRIIEAA